MEKLNIAELLKNCPTGMKLDCVSYDNVSFDKISDDKKAIYPIFCYITDKKGNRSSISFTENGCESKRYGAKCVIFPKGKTTWEGFYTFKDGDIIYNQDIKAVAIFCKQTDNATISHCFLNILNELKIPHYHNKRLSDWRLATEEEKQKLFDAIKENGYKWNAETKTLEKLVEPKFKVGDKVRVKNGVSESRIIKDVCDKFYALVPIGKIDFTDQNNWELVPDKFDINTLKPFESKVLVRNKNHYKWEGAVFGRYDGNTFFTIGGADWRYCIPYKGNEHLFGNTDDCNDYFKTWEK